MDGPERIGKVLPKALAQSAPRQAEDSERASRLILPRESNAATDVPPRYRAWLLADYPRAIREAVRPFMERRAWSVLLHGGVGTWKTSMAVAILRRYRAENPTDYHCGYSAFVDPDWFAGASRDFENGKAAVASWRAAPVLLLDDLGAYRSTPHLVESLLMLIGHRYNRQLATICTSNETLEQLAEHLDARIASRFQDGILIDTGKVDMRAEANT